MPSQLCEWLRMNLSQKMESCCVTLEDYIKTEQQLEHQLSQAVAIHGIQKLHTFIPLKCGTKIQKRLFHFPHHLKFVLSFILEIA